MKKIKTITRNVSASEEFDAEVNKALAEGWTLVKRDVLLPYEGPTHIFYRMFYAELEVEASCFNCANFCTEACDNCHLVTRDKWVPGKAPVAVSPLKTR